MRSVLYIISFLIPFIGWSSTFEEANQLYKEKKFDKAIEKYELYLESNNDASGYYNLGLAYHETGNHGKAIWAFENALKLNPKDGQVENQIIDCHKELDPNSSWNPPLSTFNASVFNFGSNFWSYLTIGLSIVFGLTMILMIKSSTGGRKKMLGLLSILVLISAGLTAFAASKSHAFENKTYAIVTSTTQATGDAMPLIKYTEGTRLEVISQIDSNFVQVTNKSGQLLNISIKDVLLY